jgi:hypothetical protein
MGELGLTTLVALAVGPFLALVVLRKAVRAESDPFIGRVIVLGFVAKLAGTAAYYLMVAEVWGGGDVSRYVRAGRGLVPIIRSGTLPDEARETGTPFMEFLVGVVFSVVGPNEIAGYLVFSMLSFVGMYLFLQAFKLALPLGDHRRYAALILLMPTLLFWPSTIGKEAWMLFTMGAAAYGAARALRAQRFGYLLLAAATAGVAAVRPHMAVLIAMSFAIAFLLRLRDRSIRQTAAAWVVGLVVVAIGTGMTASHFSDELGSDERRDAPLTERLAADTEEVLDRTERNTRRGGGEFESRPVRTPGDFVYAAVTVPFRPFLSEAHNQTAVLSSLESVFVLILLLSALPRVLGPRPVPFLRQPYLIFAATFSAGFVIAFSNVGNFGILVRQRAMLLPLLLVLAALPRQGRRGRDATERVTEPVLQVAPMRRDAAEVSVTDAGDRQGEARPSL